MKNNNDIYSQINKFAKSNKLEIFIDEINKKIFSKLIDSENIVNKIINDKKTKRIIKSIILGNKNKNYTFKNKIILEKNKYIFILIYSLVFLINQQENNIIDLSDKLLEYVFLFCFKLYKSKLASLFYISLFFHLYLNLVEKNNQKLPLKIEKMIKVIPYIKKLIKIICKMNINNKNEEEKKAINSVIYEILRKIFALNKGNNMNSFKSSIILRKQEKLFQLIKFAYNYYDNNEIISEENKNLIRTYFINLYSNNFTNENYHYLFKIYKKFFHNFNTKNASQKSYKNNLSFMTKIIEFFLDINKGEISNNEFYFDKYFIFDINEKKSGIKGENILLEQPHAYNGICIIFSFYSMMYTYNYNSPQTLLVLRNQINSNILFKVLLIGSKIYLEYFELDEVKKIVLMESAYYYKYNICILYYDSQNNLIYFYLNKNSTAQKLNLDIINNLNLYIELGHFKNKDLSIKEIFNGLMGPVLIFNSNIGKNQIELFQNILLKLKGKYYLVGEIIDNSINNFKNEDNYLFYDQIYYDGVNKDECKLIKKIQNSLGKLLLYLNPDVILNTIGYNQKSKIRDYQYYYKYNAINNTQILEESKCIFYFNSIIISDFLNKENNIFYSFMNNCGYDLIIFNIEYIYNYLLILNNNYNNLDFPLM